MNKYSTIRIVAMREVREERTLDAYFVLEL